MRDTLQKTTGVNERMSLNDPRWGRDPRDSEEEKKENARSDENEDRREDERADEGKPRDERRDPLTGSIPSPAARAARAATAAVAAG